MMARILVIPGFNYTMRDIPMLSKADIDGYRGLVDGAGG